MTMPEPPDIATALRVATAGAGQGTAATVARLADMSSLEYEQIAKAEAKRLGVRVGALHEAVKAARGAGDGAKGQGQTLDLPSPEPWPEPVDGAALLREMTESIRAYVVMEDGAAEAVALWALHAHCLDAFSISPRLAITSPEKRCGKTTCLDVIARLVPRPLSTSNISTAAIFRTIEMAKPTLLIDEADTFLSDNNEMRGVLNGGHRKGGGTIRLVGDNHEPRIFSTFAPTVIAMIGRLPDTLEDRSIPIQLRRRLPDEPVTIFRADRAGDLDFFARKAARWAADNFDALAASDPEMPAEIHNRAADNWRALFAIADAASGDFWPSRVRSIAKSLAAASADDDQSAKIMMLEDIRAVFAARNVDRLPSAELVAALINLEGRPWAEWKHGRPLTQNSLARLLRPFKVVPGDVRFGGRVQKTYRLEQFADAFRRYIPPPCDQTATPLQTAENQGFEPHIKPLHDAALLRFEKPRNPQKTAVCSGVAVQPPEPWEIDL